MKKGEQNQKLIVVVGSNIMDLTFFTHRLPQPGETFRAKKFDVGFGGKGANQAVAARLLGASTEIITKVGSGIFAESVIDNFRKFGFNLKYIYRDTKELSGAAAIFVNESGENSIVVAPGASDKLAPEDIEQAADLIKRADYLVFQLEIPLPTIERAISLKRADCKVIFNPAPAAELTDFILQNIDFFIPNEAEAAFYSGIEIKDYASAQEATKVLLAKYNISDIIITLGAQGAIYGSTSGEFQRIEPYKVSAKDTTGAGDAFIGAFAASLSFGAETLQALRLANLYAALTTTRIGTQKSYLNKQEFINAANRLGIAQIDGISIAKFFV